MCRLIGHIKSENLEISISRNEFENLTLLSKDGGPNHTGFYFDNRVDFGFNRLSILDISESGNQPIIGPSNRFVVMLNGEIYNHKDIIKKFNLENLRSQSDSEVVTQLIDKIGFKRAIEEFNGMFVVVAWDTKEEELYIVRDFAGIKPLFYSNTVNGFVFASQFDQIVLHPWLKNWTWSNIGLNEYFTTGTMLSPNTVVAGIYSLEPGQFLVYKLTSKKLELESYKQFFTNSKIRYKKETSSTTITEAHQLIKKSIENQMVADVPLGVFLSGGIDSALISAISSKIRPEIESLTIGFEDENLDESKWAKEYAKILGIKNEQYFIGSSEIVNLINDHNSKITEPLADFSSLPTYFVNKIASTKFKVMLSGDGGDEMFWGYPRYTKLLNSRYLFKLPSYRLRKISSSFYEKLGIGVSNKLSQKSIGQANFAHSKLSIESELDLILNNEINVFRIEELFEFSGVNRCKLSHYLQKNDFYVFLQKVLTKVDRNSMANGVEVRVPFLDLNLIEFIEKVIPQLTKKHNNPKYITKTILADYIPESIINQKKFGFTPPLLMWVKTELKEEIEFLLNSKIAEELDLNKMKLQIEWNKILLGQSNNIDSIWSVYMLLKWLQRIKSIKV